MKNNIMKFWTIAFVIFILDQITKYFFIGKKYLIKGFGIDYVTNTGSAFGLLKGQNILLIIVSIFVLIYVVYTLKNFSKNEHKLLKKFDQNEILLLAVFFGGVLGNLINRLVYGHVIDFIAISSFPRFNIADAAISISIVSLIIHNLFINYKTKK